MEVEHVGGVESFVSKPNPSLLGRHLNSCMEQERKETPLRDSPRP